MTYTRVSLAFSITSVRSARDDLAGAAAVARTNGATGLADLLDEAAATEDKILAELIRQEKKIQTKAEALPGA